MELEVKKPCHLWGEKSHTLAFFGGHVTNARLNGIGGKDSFLGRVRVCFGDRLGLGSDMIKSGQK